MNKREECLRRANEIVNGQREKSYGTPEDTLAETEAAASEVPQSAAEVLKESKGKTMRSSAEVIGIIRK